MEFHHVSVLLDECIENLNIKEDGVYVDCTMGGAGHSKEIVKRLSKDGLFIGFDQDKNAIATAKERLAEYSDRVRFIHSNFSNIKEELEKIGVNNSVIHVDFMIGTSDLEITGINKNGEAIQIFSNGNWAF